MTTGYVKAKDLHEAARLTHNKIMQERMDRADQIIARRRTWRDNWDWLFGQVTAAHYLRWRAELLRDSRWVRVFEEQKQHCLALMVLAEMAMTADPDAHLTVDLWDLSKVDVGWHDMKEAKDKTATRAKKDPPAPKPEPQPLLREGESLLHERESPR